MSERAQVLEMVKLIPDRDMHILLEIVRRFVPVDIDDIATPDNIAAHEAAMKEYEAGELTSHEDIDWS